MYPVDFRSVTERAIECHLKRDTEGLHLTSGSIRTDVVDVTKSSKHKVLAVEGRRHQSHG
jgi:hypothetical protein